MKMFNKVRAPFSGTVEKVLIEQDGEIIKKGQPVFKISPDEVIKQLSPEEKKARLRTTSDAFLSALV
jgi:pyruvate/2-oxoglutarate dehydrogenase complex dihydrolipoamide acyltransferase (E2) component